MSQANRFYDIHCHAMNFSHPNLFAFIKRKWTIAMLASPLAPVANFFLKEKVKKVSNLFSLMENDIACFFLIVEYFLKDMWPLVIGKKDYNRIVLTPLMMDFGCKRLKSNSFYNVTPRKAIAEQVIDVFNGIKTYCERELVELENGKFSDKPAENEDKIFEIYPFLGINTKNYTHAEIEILLAKYFSEYRHDRQCLISNMGKFGGNIDDIGSNFFAGIKVYPPLGFDPWPTDNDELMKVQCLYRFCSDMQIPITTHCSEGGFALDDNAKDYTSPEKWISVLANFRNLRLNFAHFGRQDRKWYGTTNHEWEETILKLISTYDNVYTDFSYRLCSDKDYQKFKELVSRQDGKVKKKMLFGSDFMINLLDMDSYNDYLGRFIKTADIIDDDKILFCSSNPERFLFG